MIKNLPNIYPYESVYSYLCRLYVRSGYGYYINFAKEVFKRPYEYPDYNFINVFSDDFKKLLSDQISFEELLLNHTLFKYYSIFLNKEDRLKAYVHGIHNRTFIDKLLPIQINKTNYKLRYCPLCVKEDREKYGECYYHIDHQVYENHVCSKHNCKLIDTDIDNTKSKNSVMIPLEVIVKEDDEIIINTNDIELLISQYIHNLFKINFNFESEVMIGDYLTARLDTNYLSTRGEQRKLSEIEADINLKFLKLGYKKLKKQRLANIFRNELINTYDILLLGLFENISIYDLCNRDNMPELKYKVFDREVRELYSEGLTYNAIARIMGTNKEVVRQVLLGTYEKVTKQKPKYKCKKWDWVKIDERCCEEIKGCKAEHLTKKIAADYLSLKDKTLRNLPKLKKQIVKLNIERKKS